MTAYVCVHAHFYQPPRGNPWDQDRVPRQPSAAPYHDWNERITAECYTPFSAAHVLGKDGRLARVENLFARVSFNVGPTLLEWMEQNAPETYQAILDGDRQGKGAIAQAYNHTILPLMSPRDRRKQVRWGIEDFERRFGRRPAGMWLPECAVDSDTLAALCDEGIRFTILAPQSAKHPKIDTTRPYLVPLAGDRALTVFFYNGEISQAVAFERLLDDGARFAEELRKAAVSDKHDAPLSHIATDGESYGHHHRHGEMALAFALDNLGDAKLTTYAAYLAEHPATVEMEINEPTSWSCAHGVERWRSDCGCNTGRHAGARQGWRGPLRTALDWLAHVLKGTAEHEMHRAYTSCAWFFDDPADLETLQVLAYAARAIEIARDKGLDLREEFLHWLRAVHSVTGKDGAELFLEVVADQTIEARINAFLANPSEENDAALAEAAARVTDREPLRRVQRFCSEKNAGSNALRAALGFGNDALTGPTSRAPRAGG